MYKDRIFIKQCEW